MKLSLKQRLVWILLGLMLFAWTTSALVTGAYAARLLMVQVDSQLEQHMELVGYITRVFARQVEEGVPITEPLHYELYDGGSRAGLPIVIESGTRGSMAPALNIWMDGELLSVLASSPRFARPEQQGFSFHDTGQGDSRWRTLSRYDETTGLWLLVGIEVDAARLALWKLFGRALLPLLIILPLTIALLYFGVSRGLLPLKSLAGQIASRHQQLLDPVDPREVPTEIEPVVNALNALLERLALALDSEQRFTANAAHELMTPLAAVKTEVQLCQRQLPDQRGRVMLERIAQRVERAIHTVEQLLDLARVDPDASLAMSAVDLRSLVLEELADTGHVAAARGLEVDFPTGDAAIVWAAPEALAVLLRNLLVNAFRYASEDSVVHIRLQCKADRVSLEICNECPPLSAVEFSRIRDRFYRVPGSAGPGAGLGLSIVERIAHQHSAVAEFGPGNDGLGFCARLAMSLHGAS